MFFMAIFKYVKLFKPKIIYIRYIFIYASFISDIRCWFSLLFSFFYVPKNPNIHITLIYFFYRIFPYVYIETYFLIFSTLMATYRQNKGIHKINEAILNFSTFQIGHLFFGLISKRICAKITCLILINFFCLKALSFYFIIMFAKRNIQR